ncbi:phosphatase PAP2 family protein [Porphyromonadaceae bacterium W3.11]|nr:phosphatase PAP2 family protein [Porphyromonadaceae bacterium W3.11]
MRQKDYSYLLWFFIPYFIYVTVLLVTILMTDKGMLHLTMNQYHTPFLDSFFRYYTELGASLPFVIAIGYLFYKVGSSLYILVTLGINALVTNGLKLVFREPRPIVYFQLFYPDHSLPLVEGVKVYSHNGFPSGHTSAAFALMICIVLMSKRKDIALIAFILAALLGFSRVYLSQHFTEDVLFGSAVGISVGLILYTLYHRYVEKKQGCLRMPITKVLKR